MLQLIALKNNVSIFHLYIAGSVFTPVYGSSDREPGDCHLTTGPWSRSCTQNQGKNEH